METISSVLVMVGSLVSLLMIAGLIRPAMFVVGPKRTRGRALLYYGVGCFALVSLGETVKPAEVKEQEAQEDLKKGQRLFLAARRAYLAQDYQTAQDSAKEAASTLRGARYRLPEIDHLERRVSAFIEKELLEKKAQKHLKVGQRLFLAAQRAYLSQDYQTAQDSAKEAVNTLRDAKYRLPEAAHLTDRVSAFIDSVKLAVQHQKEDAKYRTQRGTLARLVEQHAHQVYGRTVKQDGEKIPSVISVSAGYMADVAYRVGPIWSVGTLRTSLMRDTRRFMERVFTDPECHTIGTVMVRPHNVLVDKYGQNYEDQIAKLLLRREVATKINWDNLTDDMFRRLIETEGQLWLHGSFYR